MHKDGRTGNDVIGVVFRFKKPTDYNAEIFEDMAEQIESGNLDEVSCMFSDEDFLIMADDLPTQAVLAQRAGLYPNVSKTMIEQVQRLKAMRAQGMEFPRSGSEFLSVEPETFEPG